jgi:hypothetical protein
VGRGQGEGCEISRVYGKCCGWNMFSDRGGLGVTLSMLLWQVLEHLAIHKVLTVEHIYANPPRDGIERLCSPPNLATGSVDLEMMNLLCRMSKPVYCV